MSLKHISWRFRRKKNFFIQYVDLSLAVHRTVHFTYSFCRLATVHFNEFSLYSCKNDNILESVLLKSICFFYISGIVFMCIFSFAEGVLRYKAHINAFCFVLCCWKYFTRWTKIIECLLFMIWYSYAPSCSISSKN